MPKRIQRKRSKGWRMPAGAVCVTRPGVFGNPFRAGDPFLNVAKFRAWLAGTRYRQRFELIEKRAEILRRLPELRGRDLVCWCGLVEPCHADVLLELANRPVCLCLPGQLDPDCPACGYESEDGPLSLKRKAKS